MTNRQNNRTVGAIKEELVCKYLRDKGMEILEQNFRCRKGEIDIVAKDMDYLVFVEVKYRKNLEKGSPFAAVGFRKQKTICEVADFYRYMKHIDSNQKIRYDVVAVLGDDVKHLKNAFFHISAKGSW